MYSSKLKFALPVLLFVFGCSSGTPSADHAKSQNPEQVCSGLPSDARDVSLFAWQGVSFVETRTEQEFIGKAPRQRTSGARVFVPATQGMTQEYVHRVASCQAAQHSVAVQQSSDPLAVPGVEVRVSSARNGYLVDLVGDDAATGHELVRRVRAVTSGSQVDQLARSVADRSVF